MSFRRVHTMLALATALLLQAGPIRAESPPVEAGDFRERDLIELDPSLRLDMRYATAHNFLKVKMYREARAFMQRPAAEALLRVSLRLRARGLGLLILDAYRPWYVTKFIWDRSPAAWRDGGYVADPRKGSRHNRGCAVDLTLYDLRTGKPVEMPTEYDSFDVAAHARAVSGSPRARRNRSMLQEVMLAEGFQILEEEWWHFDYQYWRRYRIENVDFGEIKG